MRSRTFEPTRYAPTPSLGWELARIWARDFPNPRDESKGLILTPEQHAVLIEWYAIDPVTGRFVYRRGCSRRSKGSGKSPIEAAKCISELALPVVFDGWGADGRPIARPWGTGGSPSPWVQLAALSEDQDENTYSPLYYFLTANDGKLADKLRVDAGLTRCLLRDRKGLLEPVTSRAGSREGQPLTYGNIDESGLMVPSNGGVKLALTIRRNAGKMGGRSYETTNGYAPGESSVAEGTDKAHEAGRGGIFMDAVESPHVVDGVEVNADAPDEILEKALDGAYPGVWWVDRKRLVADIRDPDMPWSDAERFFFNWNRKSEARAVDLKVWAELAQRRPIPDDGAAVALGFVGAISERRTVLYGCTADRHLFLLAEWERPALATEWRVPRSEVHEVVSEAMRRWPAAYLFAEPSQWYSEVESWSQAWPDRVTVVETRTFARFAPICSNFVEGVQEQNVSHDDTPALTSALGTTAKRFRARKDEDEDDARRPFVLVRAEKHRPIEDAICAALALGAAEAMPEDPGFEEFLF